MRFVDFSIPPAPMGARISYSASLVPGANATCYFYPEMASFSTTLLISNQGAGASRFNSSNQLRTTRSSRGASLDETSLIMRNRWPSGEVS